VNETTKSLKKIVVAIYHAKTPRWKKFFLLNTAKRIYSIQNNSKIPRENPA
jgi:hypothetical protein